jgi:uncharacterized protein
LQTPAEEPVVSDGLLQALQNPAIYDHPVSNFKIIQTHISWVLLTGDYAYKIKKPMDFGFLDFSTLAKRKFFCEEELRLNQRTAPDIYLQVIAIGGTASAPVINGSGGAIEYAVKMRQFDPDATLDSLLSKPDELALQLDQLALQIADFHLHQATRADADSPLGTAEKVFAPVQQNFDQIRPLLTASQELAQLGQLEGWAKCTFERLRDALAARHKDGYVRECHGDMHLGNVTLIDNTATLFDCIEFNESFRWIDVLNDIAFLLMDLDDRNLQGLAARTRNRYLEQTGDYAGLNLLNFYKAYRAMVRCKIALFTMATPGLTQQAVAEESAKYRRYMQLAEHYMHVPVRFLMIMHGVSGTGKSTISTYLLQHLGAIRVRSDVERKRLHGLQPLAKSGSALDAGIYTKNASEQTYQTLANHAEHILRAGYPVILDATFLHLRNRQQMEVLAEKYGVPFIVVNCQAPQQVVEQRIEARHARGQDAAEADVEVMHSQLSSQDPLSKEECKHVITITGEDLQALDKLASQLAERLGLVY